MVTKQGVLSLTLYNEGCERFCFYGLRSLLFIFLRTESQLSYAAALWVVHLFLALSYSLPVLAGIALEAAAGAYKAVVGLAVVYLAGTLVLAYAAVFTNTLPVLLTGLFLISIGIGGLKPCIAMAYDDPDQSPVGLVRDTVTIPSRRENPGRVFRGAYFFIYIGTALSVVWAPLLADTACLGKETCYPLPFALSAFFLACSIGLLIFGARYFSFETPRHTAYGHLARALLAQLGAALHRLFKHSQPSPPATDEAATTDIRRAARLLRIFAPIVFFWMLVDQQYTSWVEQGLKMRSSLVTELREASGRLPPLSPLAMIFLAPLITLTVYAGLRVLGASISSLRSTTLALGLGASSFFVGAVLEHYISTSTRRLSILWQVPQYALMSLAELVMARSGAARLYRDAPPALRSAVLAAWLLAVAAGNLAVVLVAHLCTGLSVFHADTHIPYYVVFGLLGVAATFRMYSRVEEALGPNEEDKHISAK